MSEKNFYFSADSNFASLVNKTKTALEQYLDSIAEIEYDEISKRLLVTVYYDDKNEQQVLDSLKQYLQVDIYVNYKRQYLTENITAQMLTKENYDILIEQLTFFNLDNEEPLMQKCFNFENGVNINGEYNFKISEVKTQMKRVENFAKDMFLHLHDNTIMKEFFRFMMLSRTPVINNITLSCIDNGSYFIKNRDDNKFIREYTTGHECLLELIRLAPNYIKINGDFKDKTAYEMISTLFNVEPQAPSV